jgi:hypothetical protein
LATDARRLIRVRAFQTLQLGLVRPCSWLGRAGIHRIYKLHVFAARPLSWASSIAWAGRVAISSLSTLTALILLLSRELGVEVHRVCHPLRPRP